MPQLEIGWRISLVPSMVKLHTVGFHQSNPGGSLDRTSLNRGYTSAKAAAVENWFWNLPSGENIRKKIPFLWPNRPLERKVAQVFLKLNYFCRL
jgi:hypothetical protein